MNIRIEQDLPLTRNGSLLVYENYSFFPLDGQGWADPSLSDPDVNCDCYVNYGASLIPQDCPANCLLHNYFFTTEIRITFTYTQSGQKFNFIGDDDVSSPSRCAHPDMLRARTICGACASPHLSTLFVRQARARMLCVPGRGNARISHLALIVALTVLRVILSGRYGSSSMVN